MFTRTKSLPQRIIVLLIFRCALIAHAQEFAGGTGEPNDPYGIATAEKLVSIGSDPNLLDKHFVLLNDIDLDPNLPGGRTFTQAVIAPDMNDAYDFQGVPFTGCFDGNDCTIRNLTMTVDDVDFLGLFGAVGKQGVVKNPALKLLMSGIGMEAATASWQAAMKGGLSAVMPKGVFLALDVLAAWQGRTEAASFTARQAAILSTASKT